MTQKVHEVGVRLEGLEHTHSLHASEGTEKISYKTTKYRTRITYVLRKRACAPDFGQLLDICHILGGHHIDST